MIVSISFPNDRKELIKMVEFDKKKKMMRRNSQNPLSQVHCHYVRSLHNFQCFSSVLMFSQTSSMRVLCCITFVYHKAFNFNPAKNIVYLDSILLVTWYIISISLILLVCLRTIRVLVYADIKYSTSIFYEYDI